MQERTKAQITIGFLAFFSSMWILLLQNFSDPLYMIGYILLVLAVILVLSYVIIAILDWIHIFELKVNAVLTLIVLTSFMLSLTMYLLLNSA